MRKLKLYLETSVWNFFFADDAPEKREITKEFVELFHSANLEAGYFKRIEIITPMEVIRDES